MNAIIKRKFLEGLFPAIVLMSLGHLFLDEFAVYAKWSVSARYSLFFTGLVFDLVFSIEFAARGLTAARRGSFISYIMYGKGWADLISSFPLLIFYSGPSLYLLLTADVQSSNSSAFLSEILHVVAVIRMPQVLRGVRVFKLTGCIPVFNSGMTRHHTSTAATIAVFTVGAVIAMWYGISGLSGMNPHEKRSGAYSKMLVELESIAALNNLEFRESCENFLISDHNVIRIDYADGKKYERLSESEFLKYYNGSDYKKVQGKLCSLNVAFRDINSETALQNIQCSLIMMALAAAFILLYSRHFSLTVSDVARILNAGFRKKDYNLMIKIKDQYRNESLYRLAQFYNDAYLPAKMRKRDMERDGSGTPLAMDSVKKFNNVEE